MPQEKFSKLHFFFINLIFFFIQAFNCLMKFKGMTTFILVTPQIIHLFIFFNKLYNHMSIYVHSCLCSKTFLLHFRILMVLSLKFFVSFLVFDSINKT